MWTWLELYYIVVLICLIIINISSEHEFLFVFVWTFLRSMAMKMNGDNGHNSQSNQPTNRWIKRTTTCQCKALPPYRFCGPGWQKMSLGSLRTMNYLTYDYRKLPIMCYHFGYHSLGLIAAALKIFKHVNNRKLQNQINRSYSMVKHQAML